MNNCQVILALCILRKLRLVLSNNPADADSPRILMGISHTDLAEARRAGREAMDLHRLIVVGVILVV